MTTSLFFAPIAATAALLVGLRAFAADSAPSASVTLRLEAPGPVVNPNLYGHFAEHLGHCIYTSSNDRNKRKTHATEFAEDGWFRALREALKMEELIVNHSLIMDKYDPAKKVGMVIDEWGIWYAVEKDTNPGFLYQQNTLRDGVIAALHFHIFQRHADRVSMTNIAQTVNVLQAMILTQGGKMLRTPTYWVFEMFKGHQGGTVIQTEIQSPDYVFADSKIPALSASATRSKDGAILLSLTNTHPNQPLATRVVLAGIAGKTITGRILTAATMQAHNTFEAPDAVQPTAFAAFKATDAALSVEMPAKSVVTLEIR